MSVEFLHPYFHTLKMCTGDAGPEQSLALLDLNLSITNDIVSSKIYDKRDDFNFEIFFFDFLVEMFLATLPMVYIFHSLFVLQESVLMLMT